MQAKSLLLKRILEEKEESLSQVIKLLLKIKLLITRIRIIRSRATFSPPNSIAFNFKVRIIKILSNLRFELDDFLI